MSKFHKFIRPTDFSPVMQAVQERITLHFRADMVETLARGKSGPPAFKSQDGEKHKPVGDVFLAMTKELDKRQRRALSRNLMTKGTKDVPLSEKDKLWLRKYVDPKSKIPLAERSKLMRDISDILEPKEPIKDGDRKALHRWVSWVFGSTLPERALNDLLDTDPNDGTGTNTGNQGASAPYASLSFVVDRLFCADTTNGEAGRDEISFRTIHTRGETALSSNPNRVGGEISSIVDAGQFTDGDTNDFSPDLIMHTWDLTGITYPHMFATFFAMAETDPSGGFATYTRDFLDSLDAEMQSIWRELVGMWVGLAIWTFGTATLVLGVIGLLVAAIIMAIFAIFYLLVGAFVNYDDIFDLGAMVVVLDEDTPDNPPFFGNARSMSFTDRLSGDGGAYDVTYHWQLSDPT